MTLIYYKIDRDIRFQRTRTYIATLVPRFAIKLDSKVDTLVFTGRTGKKRSKLRKAVARGVRYLRFEMDEERNVELGKGVVIDISSRDAKHKTLVVRTDE